MRLFWSSRSPYARKVMVMAHEAGLADRIERVTVTVSPYAVNAAVLTYNPLGRIPALVTDDGTVLIESLAICDYFDRIAARPVGYPPGVDRTSVSYTHALGAGLTDLGIGWVRERFRRTDGAPQDFIDAARIKISATCDRLDAEIVRLDGQAPHVGAAAVGCALGYLDFRLPQEDWRAGRERLATWYDRLSARPSFRATEHSD